MEMKRHFGAKAKDDFTFRSSQVCRSTPVSAQRSLSHCQVWRSENLPQKTFLFALLVPERFLGHIYSLEVIV